MEKPPPMEWSVHAQLTFRGPAGGVEPPTVTSFCSADGGVRMEYTFRGRASSPQPPPPANTAPEYNFQRGNMVFTSRPPARQQGGRSRSFNATSDKAAAASNTSTLVVGGGRCGSQPPQTHDSSGYSSEQQYNSLPSRQPARQHAYDRRCMSTASIVLVQPHHHFSPLPEHPGGRKEVRDAEVQTATPLPPKKTSSVGAPRMGAKAYNSRRKTDSDMLLQVPSLQLPDADFEPRNKSGRQLCRSPARLGGKSPLLQKRAPARESSPESSNHSLILPASGGRSDGRRPRTMHIDVYCTGSEEDEDADDSGSSTPTSSFSSNTTTPQTVFDSGDFRVTHTKMGRNVLPGYYGNSRQAKSFKYTPSPPVRDELLRGYQSDSTTSSLYPSRSSFESMDIPLRDASWSTITSSVAPYKEDTTSSSWKDTNDSWVDIADVSLDKCDSFDYADSVDKARIAEKEKDWCPGGKNWRSPEAERRQLLQKQRFNEFLAKHLPKKWSGSSTSDWSQDLNCGKVSLPFSGSAPSVSDTASLSGEFISFVSPIRTPPPPKFCSKPVDVVKLTQRFGPMVGSLKKPGTHSGPSKNPDCQCDHCRSFYDEAGFRDRAYSAGDVPTAVWPGRELS